jgi:DNA-binding transcriptional MerR regulator
MTSRGITISEFGRRSGLSVKALRLYEASGLLPPAEVDPASSYRRYAPDQLARAGRISLLRRLGMPLALIAEVLRLPDAAAARHLDRWWAGEDAAFTARRESYTWLRTQMAHGDEPPRDYPVRVASRPARKVATLRFEVDQESLVPAMTAAEWDIRRHLDDQGVSTTGEHWVVYHQAVTPETEAPIEVCVPFSGSAEPAGQISIRMEPEHLVVYAEVTRDDCFYPRITQAYEAVERHVAGAGLIRTGPPREIYLDSWDRLAPTDPFVHVAQPFEG